MARRLNKYTFKLQGFSTYKVKMPSDEVIETRPAHITITRVRRLNDFLSIFIANTVPTNEPTIMPGIRIAEVSRTSDVRRPAP